MLLVWCISVSRAISLTVRGLPVEAADEHFSISIVSMYVLREHFPSMPSNHERACVPMVQDVMMALVQMSRVGYRIGD
jgi:hypothetical protein